jgi:hypothetical protein
MRGTALISAGIDSSPVWSAETSTATIERQLLDVGSDGPH